MVDWQRCSSCEPVEGSGIFVQRESQLGYAKLDYLASEKLGSDLALLAGLPVPIAEIDMVEGIGPFVISHVHSKLSRPLVAKGQFSQGYSSAETTALKSASGLLPYFAWIAAEDHYDDTNLVVDELGDGQCRITAIDFEHAFRWTPGEHKIILKGPPGLTSNIDPLAVRNSLAAIAGITAKQIDEACRHSGYPPELQEKISHILHERQNLLRAPMEAIGWLGASSLRD
jgi:hypothetical protein